MSKETARQEAKPQTIETTSTILIDSVALGKKDSLHILHVDDDVCFLEVSKQILSMENNFEIDTALSVDEAFQKMEKQTFDAIVSDFEMPLKNGLEFLRELREQRNEIPFILFTGKGREEVAVEALNLGADRYINKNGSPETVYCELAHAINKTAEQRKSRKLLAASESKYRMLVEKSLQGILITLADPLRLVFANDTMGKILGYSSQELMSLSPERIMGLVYHEDRAVFFKRMENRFRGKPAESCLEFRAVRKDGSIIWLDALSSRVEYDGQPAVQGVFLDVNERKKAEEVLRRSEEKYRELANCLPEIVFETDMNGQLVFANERAAEISGYSLSEIEKGLSILQFIAPEDRERGTKIIQRLLAGGGCVPAEYTFVRKDGTTFPALITATPRISENKVAGLRGLVIDITERKQATESLEKEQRELDCIVDSSPIIIFYKDKEGKFIRVNKTFAETLKIPKGEFLGKTVFDIYSAKIAQDMTNDDSEVLRSGHPKLGIIEQYESASGIRWVQTDKVPIFDKNGTLAGLVGFAQDITEQKKVEKALREAEEKYRETIVSANVGIIAYDPKGEVKILNPKMEEMTGFTSREIPTLTKWFEKLYPNEEERRKVRGKWFKRMSEEGEVKEGHAIITTKEGKRRNLLFNGFQLKSGDFIAFAQDITERKKMEDTLRQDQDMLEAITENLGAGFVTISKDYRVLYANRFVKNNVGNVEGKPCYATLNTLDHVCPDCGVKKVFEDGAAKDSHEYSQVGIDGKPYYVELIATPLKDKDGNVTAALEFVIDIAEKKRMQQTLQANEAKFRAISDSAIDAIFMFNEEDRITYWNPAAERIFGYTEKEIVGEKVGATIVPPRFHKDHLKLTSELGKVENMKKNAGEILEFPAFRKDGTEFSMELSMAPLQLEGKLYIVAIARDITDRKKAEGALDRTMNELVLVNEKLGVVGSLTRHDVRNKLSAVTGYAYLLKKKHADQADVLDGVSKMEQAVKEIAAIFDFAKMYEQLGVEELKYINAEKALNGAIALFSGSSSLEFINDCHGLSLLADSLLTQLFYNLIDNSLKHGEKVTKIRVHYEKADQDELIVVYEDDGVGVSAENKPKLFKEGFSTSGTSGYGLFLMRKMMSVYGWTIQENGEPGKGAKFTITIPRINQNGKVNFQIAK
jgi:PAS domain S-box-containing protein